MSGEDTRCTNCGHSWNHHSFSGMCRYADMTGDECGCHSFAAQPPERGEIEICLGCGKQTALRDAAEALAKA